MRIAFVIYGSLDNVSGGFIYDRALVGALRARDHEVEVVALPWRAYFHAAARHALRGAGRAGGPIFDVAIQDELVHPSLFLFNDRPPRARLRLALVHNLRCRQPGEALAALKTSIERRYFSTVDGALAVCRRTLADIHDLAGPLPALVLPPGRDHLSNTNANADANTNANANPLRILHLASVIPPKGLHRLLDALAATPDLDFTLDVVGNLAARRYVGAIERQTARLGLASRVRLHGQRTGAELRAMFQRCDVLALPSDREAYSLACLEALGFGLPVLATSVGGLDEMITNGREGYLLDPRDTGAWARALGELARDRAARAAMSRAALARHRAHATWDEVAAALERFVTERLEATAPPERPGRLERQSL